MLDTKVPAQTKNQLHFVGQSLEIKRVSELIEKVAGSDSTVLLCGESGTGKEVAAKLIHYQSHRADKPFIPINCGAIPETLLESELFGHEKGAFTGANNVRLGRFELANGGTIFFDEISEMPYPLQVKLLRVIQELEFERIGGTRSIKVDVRIIAATNTDLERAVLEKRFRNDLFYRLNVIPIMLPPLRERKGDLPLLVSHFLDRCNQKKQKTVEVSKEAADLFLAYPWPGNIRELENTIERVVILNEGGIITPEEIPEKIRATSQHPLPDLTGPDPPFSPSQNPSPSPAPMLPSGAFAIPDEGIPFTEWVEAFENRLIQEALKKANGVKSRAAQFLRLNRTTLVEKLKRRNIEEATPNLVTQGAQETNSTEKNASKESRFWQL